MGTSTFRIIILGWTLSNTEKREKNTKIGQLSCFQKYLKKPRRKYIVCIEKRKKKRKKDHNFFFLQTYKQTTPYLKNVGTEKKTGKTKFYTPK